MKYMYTLCTYFLLTTNSISVNWCQPLRHFKSNFLGLWCDAKMLTTFLATGSLLKIIFHLLGYLVPRVYGMKLDFLTVYDE